MAAPLACFLRQRLRRARQRFARLCFEPLEARLAPAILIVNSLADGPLNLGDNTVTLRDAIKAANDDLPVTPSGPVGSGADEIQFTAGLAGTIALTQGELRISSDLTITGLGAGVLTISGNNASRVFNVDDGTATVRTVTISGLTITSANPGNAFGGGVYNRENLMVQNSTLTENASLDGGGIYNLGTINVQNSTLTGNSAENGGGLSNDGTATLQNSAVSNNTSTFQSGGIYEGPLATLTVLNSTISGNKTAMGGGGIYADGSVTVRDSTITQNYTDTGNNGADAGGGIFAPSSGVVILHNTIVADNFRGGGAATRDDINGAVSGSSQSNLIGDGTGLAGISNGNGGNQIGTTAAPINPQLAPLANNGGPTLTHALLSNSPALNAGNNALIPSDTLDLDGDGNVVEPIPFDQRGAPFARIAANTVDIGAFEFALNHAPTCTIGQDQNTTDEKALQTIADWITDCSANDPGQSILTVTVGVDKPELFTSLPSVDPVGTLTYDPKPNVQGMATVIITIMDDGGVASGGSDITTVTRTIDVAKPHPWHNALNKFDVTGEKNVFAADAFAVITRLNAFGAGLVPNGAAIDPPFFDVTGENTVSAADALAVIAQLNAFGPSSGEGEAGGSQETGDRDQAALGQADMLALVAADVAGAAKRKTTARTS